jgi:hypothetical protein
MYILQIFFKPCIYIFKVFESEEGGVLQKKLRCITEKKEKKPPQGGVLQKKKKKEVYYRKNMNIYSYKETMII